MANTFFIADTHFRWPNGYTPKITRSDGSPLRPMWTNTEVADEAMVEMWNATVGPHDKVYHLGDVTIGRRGLKEVVGRLNGKKRLVRGNHDIFRTKEYMEHFDEVYGVRVFPDAPFPMILSHVPLKRDAVMPRFGVNVHGHTHSNWDPDPAYFSVCVEMIDFRPIELEELKKRVEEKRNAS